MKYTYRYIFLVAFSYCLSCASTKQDTAGVNILPATALNPFGRFILNQNEEVELISSAVHFGFSFEGTDCQIFASVPYGHNYLQYELDGVYQKRLKISGSTVVPITISAPKPGKHIVWIYKATEAHTGPIAIQKISGQKIKSLEKPKAPIIEFIGNSITCGAAADPSEVPCGTGQYHDQHNAYAAYGPGVARALKVNFVLSSVSGIGMYRNWNSDGPTMPQVYEKVDFQDKNPQRWNFNSFTPAVVSIALGTNDFSNGDGKKPRLPFDSALYVSNYSRFVQLVKSKYPKARIALISSPMINGKNRLTLQNCLNAIKSNIDKLSPTDKPVALHFFRAMQAHGCSGHPNVDDHALMAKELVPFYKALL